MNNRILTLPFEPWMGVSGLGMSGNEKAVFAAIWELAKTKPCEIGLSALSNRTGLSLPTVLKYINSLMKRGYIRIDHPAHGRTANRYSIPEGIKGAKNG